MKLKLGSSYPRPQYFHQIAPQATVLCKVIVKVAILYGSLTTQQLSVLLYMKVE